MQDLETFLDSELTLLIRPNDFDYAGYVNNAVYLEYLEAGRVDWAGRNGLELVGVPLAPAVVRLELDYCRGIIRGQGAGVVVILTRLAAIQPVRLVFEQQVKNGSLLCAQARVEVVMVNLERGRPVAVTKALERLRSLIQPLADGV